MVVPELERERVRIDPPIRTAHGLWEFREALILRASGGKCGEAGVVPGFGGSTIETLESAARRWLKSPSWDEASLRDFPPEWQFAVWGASEGPVETPPLVPGARLLRDADEPLDPKVTHFKWKVGIEPIGTELMKVRRLLHRLPKGARLRLDANGGIDFEEWNLWLGLLGDPRIEFLEQPFPPGDGNYERSAVRAWEDKLALDESVRTYRDWRSVLEEGWQGWGVIKPSLAGWPDPEVLADPRIVITSAFETEVGWRGVAWLAGRYGRNVPGLSAKAG